VTATLTHVALDKIKLRDGFNPRSEFDEEQRVLAGRNGELWFAAHTRAAPEEMHARADSLLAHLDTERLGAPALIGLVVR
jgi:hypothetical protein